MCGAVQKKIDKEQHKRRVRKCLITLLPKHNICTVLGYLQIHKEKGKRENNRKTLWLHIALDMELDAAAAMLGYEQKLYMYVQRD